MSEWQRSKFQASAIRQRRNFGHRNSVPFSRARGRGISPIGGAEENRRAVEDAGPYGCVHRDAVKHRGAGGGAPIGATAVNEMG